LEEGPQHKNWVKLSLKSYLLVEYRERFITYESTEERLLPFLIMRNAGQSVIIPSLRAMLSFMSKTLKILSKEGEKRIGKIEESEEAQAAEESKKGSSEIGW